MGNIGYKFLLIFIRLPELMSHIIQGGGQLTDLILPLNLRCIGKIALRIMSGGRGDLQKRSIYGKGEDSQDEQ